ncbi:hypothetical protein BJV78DRAFT_842058 [Lactifluus subvellereus]|nr:hypothetical protein BJV78DRAFT_842058 [Lactifluus subvellereus]
MVNWNDPSVVFNDYLALTKLDHVIAGIYIWETVFTAGFELDVLRGKRPYRWSIWLYLGARYTTLLTVILTLIIENGGKVSCQPFTIADAVLTYASWAFASLTIVLRVQVIPATLTILPSSSCHFSSRIAIWNRQRIVSFLSVGIWLAGVGTLLHSTFCIPNCIPHALISHVCVCEGLTTVKALYDPHQNTCTSWVSTSPCLLLSQY